MTQTEVIPTCERCRGPLSTSFTNEYMNHSYDEWFRYTQRLLNKRPNIHCGQCIRNALRCDELGYHIKH